MRNTCAMLMAGGHGSRLSVLSELRAKPAVVFGGIYRIIDFTMSNAMHAQIPYVGICTQYRPYSLTDHLSMGEAWGYNGMRRVARVLPPYIGEKSSDWYAGTADAIYQNLNFIDRFESVEHVLILSADHIYHMDYAKLLEYHLDRDADLTLATQEIPWEETDRFGIAVVDGDDRIRGFQEKPKKPRSNLANLGIYLFKLSVLKQRLRENHQCPDTQRDFGQDVIPEMVHSGDRVFAYRFQGFWRDVGTVHSLWKANMDLLDPDQSGLDLNAWKVRTNPRVQNCAHMVPAKITHSGQITHSLVSRGCIIEGQVKNSVISPGVRVHSGARIERSVIMNDVEVGSGARVSDAIVDKQVRIAAGAVVGEGDDTPNDTLSSLLNQGLTLIGKRAVLPRGIRIGRNCLIYPYAHGEDYARSDYPSGATVYNEKYRHALDHDTFHAPQKAG